MAPHEAQIEARTGETGRLPDPKVIEAASRVVE